MNNNTFNVEEMNYLMNNFKNKNGQRYPCSNQIVINAFFSDRDKWNQFIKCFDSKYILKQEKDSITLNNGEYWKYFTYNHYECRGYRFYKVYVDKRMNRSLFFENIYPYMNIYCKELKFI